MDVRRAVGWVLFIGAVPFVAFFGFGLAAALALNIARLNGWALVALLAQGLAALAIPLAVLLVGWRLAHSVPAATAHLDVAPRARPKPIPVAALDEPAIDQVELLAQLEGPVSACPECGFLGVRAPSMRDGLWPGGVEALHA